MQIPGVSPQMEDDKEGKMGHVSALEQGTRKGVPLHFIPRDRRSHTNYQACDRVGREESIVRRRQSFPGRSDM